MMRWLRVLSMIAVLCFAAVCWFLLPGQVNAQVVTVPCGDTTTLLEKIAEANTNIIDETIILQCASGQTGFILTDEIIIRNAGSLTIEGNGATFIQTTVNRIFHVEFGATLNLDSVRLQNGNIVDGDGGTILNRGVLRLDDVDIWNSGVSTGNGGAIYNKGTLIVDDSDIFNATLGNGDGVALFSALTSTVVWTDSDVRASSLTGTAGNGIIYNAGAFNMIGRSLYSNSGTSVIYNANTGNMIIDDVRINFNDDAALENRGMLAMLDSEIADNGNQSSGAAGGLKNYADVDVFGSEFRNNWFYNVYNGQNGEMSLRSINNSLGNYGVQNNGGDVSIEDSTINSVSVGIVQNSGSLIIQRSAISQATTGITIASGEVEIYRSGIYGNTKNGIILSDGELLIAASTISGNRGLLQTGADTYVPTEGGGLAIYQGDVTLFDSTITQNTGLQGGGVWVYSDGLTYATVTLQNTIVAGNSVPENATGPDIYGPLILNGVNFIGSSRGAVLTGSMDILSGNPLLAPLAANGGLALSHLPYPNSPLIDAGLCSSGIVDQRGVARPFDLEILPNKGFSNGCDIGAVERNTFADAVPTTNSENYITPYQTPITVLAPGILANDSIFNASFIPILVSDVKHGTLILNTDGSFSYEPNEGFSGTDFFTYRLQNESVVSNIATVVITVSSSENTPPVGHLDIYSIEVNQSLNVVAAGVLNNDVDVDSDRAVLRAIKVSDPFNGSLILNTNGSFVYTPTPGFIGSDLFEYRVSDGIFESEVTIVAINVVPVGGLLSYGPAPVDLHVQGNFKQAPVLLTFKWQNTLGDVTPLQWYRLIVIDQDDVTAFDEWFPAPEICGMLTCTIEIGTDLLPAGFINGYYRWRVQSWEDGLFSLPSIEAGFTITVPTAILLQSSMEVEVETGRPVVVFPNSANATWYQVFIGTGGGELRHLRWYEKDAALCDALFCTLYPDVSLLAGNYQMWVQAWGPGGFGLGDVNTGSGGWAGPLFFTLDALIPDPAAPLMPAFADSGRPEFNWQRTNGAIWYQIWVYDPTDASSIADNLEWVNTLNSGCISTLTCTWTPDFLLDNNRTYQWMLQGWGPGGFSTSGNPSDVLDGWAEGESFTVNASTPQLPVPITPTNLVTQPVGLTFTWVYDPQVSWYQFEINQTNSLPISVDPLQYSNWYPAESLGCREIGICVLKLGFRQPNGEFEWRLRAYNPAVMQLLESAWSSPQSFTIQR